MYCSPLGPHNAQKKTPKIERQKDFALIIRLFKARKKAFTRMGELTKNSSIANTGEGAFFSHTFQPTRN